MGEGSVFVLWINQEEPYESRCSRTVPCEPGAEIPLGYTRRAPNQRGAFLNQSHLIAAQHA